MKVIRLASLGISCGLLLLALRGVASAGPRVPEIDPGSAGSGIALLVGAALVLIERVRRR